MTININYIYPHPVPKMLVKNVFDETGETVAIATILTMVKKLDQS